MSKQIDKKLSKQVRVDAGMIQLLKIKAAESQTSIKSLVEGYITEGLKEDTVKN